MRIENYIKQMVEIFFGQKLKEIEARIERLETKLNPADAPSPDSSSPTESNPLCPSELKSETPASDQSPS